jgi:hypothetical protein
MNREQAIPFAEVWVDEWNGTSRHAVITPDGT